METKRLPGYKRKVIGIMSSPEMAGILLARANRIRNAAGDGHESSTFKRRDRYSASVITATPRTMYHQAKNKTLTKAIDAGRG